MMLKVSWSWYRKTFVLIYEKCFNGADAETRTAFCFWFVIELMAIRSGCYHAADNLVILLRCTHAQLHTQGKAALQISTGNLLV